MVSEQAPPHPLGPLRPVRPAAPLLGLGPPYARRAPGPWPVASLGPSRPTTPVPACCAPRPVAPLGQSGPSAPTATAAITTATTTATTASAATATATASTATAAIATAATATASLAYCATMASLRVLAFDHEGRPVRFDTWLDDLELYLLSDIKDGVSLFDHVSGAATAPPTTADSATRSQWLSRDAAARLAIRNHLPLAECAHFGQHRTAQALYDAVVARYSSPATAALGRLLLPYLFPELSAFATIEDLVSHLCASDTRYSVAVPAEDHFLSLDPTSLPVDLLEQHLLAIETSEVGVGAARGTPRPPFFEGCSPSPIAPSYASAAATDISVAEDVGASSASAKQRSGKGKGGKGGGSGSGGGGGGSGSSGGGSSGGGGGGGTGGGSGGSGGGGGGSGGSGGGGGSGTGGCGTGARRVGSGGGQRQQQQRRRETQSPQQLREWFLRGASGGSCPYVNRTGDRAGQTCGRLHTQHRCFSRLDDAWRAEFGDDVKLPRWADLLRSRIAIFDLDFDAILSAMYALSISVEGDCYRGQVRRRRDYERRGGSGRQLKLLAHGATGATGTRATGAIGTLTTGATGTRATGVTGSAANSERQEQRTHGRLEQRAHGQLEQRAHERLAQRCHRRLELLASRWPPPFNLPKLSHPPMTHPLLHP
ncbi:unnamed protein product [Closterium sp. NIES-53]